MREVLKLDPDPGFDPDSIRLHPSKSYGKNRLPGKKSFILTPFFSFSFFSEEHFVSIFFNLYKIFLLYFLSHLFIRDSNPIQFIEKI